MWPGLAPHLSIVAAWGWTPDYRSSAVDPNGCFVIPVPSRKIVKHMSAKQMLADMQAWGEGRILKHVTQLRFSKQTHTEANVTHYYPIIRAGIKSSHTHWFSVFTTPIKPSGVLFWVVITYGIIKSLSLCVAPLLKLKCRKSHSVQQSCMESFPYQHKDNNKDNLSGMLLLCNRALIMICWGHTEPPVWPLRWQIRLPAVRQTEI